jgi:tetratricopeptide (TPR) repeat protein
MKNAKPRMQNAKWKLIRPIEKANQPFDVGHGSVDSRAQIHPFAEYFVMVEPACKLSVAVIVRDAAEQLRLTLASIRQVASEIVVVDTGSADKSKEVAREFGARVFDFAWSDDFSAARNFAWDQLTGDWVLWLDAGETLSDSDAVALGEFVKSVANRACAYMLLVRVPPVDAQAAIEQIGQVRLLPNHPAIRFTGRVRESCTESLATLNMSIQAAPAVIERGEREHDQRVKKQRAHRNIRLAEREQRERGLSARLWNCLGDALQSLGQVQRAVGCFHQAVAIATRGSADQLEAFYGLLTLVQTPPGKPAESQTASSAQVDTSLPVSSASNVAETRSDDALQVSMQALEVFPLDAQLLCFLAGCLHTRGHSQLALQAYRTAYQFGQVDPSVWHIVDIRDVSATCYSVSLHLEQKQDEAVRFLEEALNERPESIKLRRHLIEVYASQGNRDAAVSHVGALPRNFPNKDAFRSAVRGACYAVQKNWLAAKSYLETAYAHGCRDLLCLKWLAATLLASGQVDAARPVLEEWSAAEPRNLEPARVLKSITEQQATAPAREIRVDRPSSPLRGNSIPLNFGATSFNREPTATAPNEGTPSPFAPG